MNSILSEKLVPQNVKGKATDLHESVTCNNKDEAATTFKRASKRLLNPNIWHELSGFGSGVFILVDITGKPLHRLAASGDYLRIDMPGPGTKAGDGFDWVHVESIEEDINPESGEESIGVLLRPCSNPSKSNEEAAHFFKDSATSTFIINRKNTIVTASYYGRNEVLNTGTENVLDKVRNVIVGSAALIGVSEMQWKSLIKSFLQEEL